MKNKIKLLSNNSLLFYVIMTLLLFSYIYQYNLSFIGVPESFHSTRLSALLIIIVSIFYRLKKKHYNTYKTFGYVKLKLYLVACVILTLFSFILYICIGKQQGFHIFEYMANILIFGIPVIWALSVIFDKLEDFMLVLVLVGILQSISIILCLSSPIFSQIIDSTFNSHMEEFFRQHRGGYAGGIGCITSAGVVKFSLSLIACVHLFLKSKKVLYLIIFIILSIIATLISRTGLIIVVLGMYFIIRSLTSKQIVKMVITLFTFVFLIFLIPKELLDDFISTRFYRYSELFESGLKQNFFDAYFHGSTTIIPPINLETILGTGMLSGISGNGYRVNVDGGFLRTYSAIGLPLTIVFYTWLFYQMYSIYRFSRNQIDKQSILLLIIVLLVAEFKEMTFVTVWSLSMFYSVSILVYKTNKI